MNRLKQLREEKHLTQVELSKALYDDEGIFFPASQMDEYESGIAKMSNNTFWQWVADYFGVTLAYLKGESKIPNEDYIIDLQDVLHREYELKLENAKLEKNLEEALAKIDEKDKRISELEEKIDYIFSELGNAFKRKG